MAVQHERGVSASSAAMGFEHDGLAVNLLDPSTRFSEETYRSD
jgi:peptide subunit release factor RF-3